mmetsp:Transcript_2275/g.6547  ORF Transcript_2275/g.6547 Transcript_2275/m.6547 type:complete len:209 (-) Transcript_2275:736-1362(-)
MSSVETKDARLAQPTRSEHALHLQNLPKSQTDSADFLLGQGAEVPHVVPDDPPVCTAAGDGCLRSTFATEVVSVTIRPSEQFSVEVPTHGILGKNGDLRSRVKEVVVKDLDHLSRLARTSRMVHEKTIHRTLGMQQERHCFLVRLQGGACTRGHHLWRPVHATHTTLEHHGGATITESLSARQQIWPHLPRVIRITVIVSELLVKSIY